MGWTPDQLPSRAGCTYAITGGNSGLGLEAATWLAQKGARVVLTARSEAKAQGALAHIRGVVPDADADFVLLDLADLDSVARAADALREACPTLDGVVNNAGVMQPPLRRTAQGFELQLGTNHLGHFRLNSLLFHHLEASGGRIVPVASIAHKYGSIDFDDLNADTRYDPSARYAQSKLANLLYGFELHRRLVARGSAVSSIPCHPGYAATNLQSAGVGMDGGSVFFRLLYKVTNAVMAQSATAGAIPLVLAVADPDAEPGTYYGPTAMGQARGPVGPSFVAARARDEAVAQKLWERTEEMVGAFFR